MLTVKQLTYALAVEKTLHFRKAADLCHVSQSTLSTALNELERQLGLQIFERDNKRVLITPIGQDVLNRGREIINSINDLQRLADGQKTPLSYPITIGVIPTIAPFMLPKVLPVLSDQYPNADITIVEEQSHVLVEKVRSGDIDAAILALPYPIDGLLAMEFWQEDFYWIALSDDDSAKQTEITSDELLHKNLMLLADGHCLKDHILDACKLPKQTANHGVGATSLATLIQMVLGKMGTTLVPAMALDQL
ncbi:MAG: LysR substrate-binding domain-containing protein, partial [Kangiellaceae bacterium]|nr:LysR substrate-binding domain-containing protein [Kangiellaceae bacterium]